MRQWRATRKDLTATMARDLRKSRAWGYFSERRERSYVSVACNGCYKRSCKFMEPRGSYVMTNTTRLQFRGDIPVGVVLIIIAIIWKNIYIFHPACVLNRRSKVKATETFFYFNPDFESNNTSASFLLFPFFNSHVFAVSIRRGEDFKISRPSGNVRLHRKIEGREILDSPPGWISSFDELCKRSWRGSRVGQRKWLESAAAETGKIKGERCRSGWTGARARCPSVVAREKRKKEKK